MQSGSCCPPTRDVVIEVRDREPIMLSISRILLPVDFSVRCMGMLQYAKAAAANYGAELILLHVANPTYEVPATGLTGVHSGTSRDHY
jgi:hypothetical protein